MSDQTDRTGDADPGDGTSDADHDSPPYPFQQLDEETFGNRRRRPPGVMVAVGCGLVAVGALAVAHSPGDPLVLGWYPIPLDWLFAASLVICAGVVAPIVGHDRVRREFVAKLRRRPGVVLSLGWLTVVFVLGLFWPVLFGKPNKSIALAYQPPVGTSVTRFVAADCAGQVVDNYCHGTLRFPLGTNEYGENMLALVVSGMRVVVILTVATTALVAPIATAVGTAAGYLGGWTDAVLMRYVEIQRTVPAFLVYVVLILVVRPSHAVLILVFGLLNWGGIAQVVRAEARTLREAEYVRAARGAGASHLTILVRHVVPNVAGTVVTATTRTIPALILVEAAIAFLELNDVQIRSWGEIIVSGMNQFFPVNWWIVTWPSLALIATVVAISVFGDFLRDVFDPTAW